MCLHGVFAGEQLLGDLAVTQAGRNQLEDLQLARRDAKLLLTRDIGNERARDRRGNLHFTDDDAIARSRDAEPQPNPERREEQRDQATVYLDRMLDEEVAILDQLEAGDQDSTEHAVDENSLPHAEKNRWQAPHTAR